MMLLSPLLLAFSLAVASSSIAGPLRAQGTPPPSLPAVTLQDQFGAATTVSELRAPVIVLVAGREGSEAMKRWLILLRAIAPSTGEVRLLQVADLKGAPLFVKGRIRASMPRDTSVRILLDWDGKFGRVVRGDRGDLVAAVYGADGRLRKWEALSLSNEDRAVAQALLRVAGLP